MFDTTIAAIATSLGNSGINIIRISGEESLNIANKIFIGKKNKKLIELRERYLNYGYIINPDDNKIIDEVLITYMKAPYTYTKEDIVEINCHGGIISSRKILEILLKNGCFLAERGEFTKRAFLNGRIDLTQAEAVIDIINAKTETIHEMSVNQLEGRLSKEINKLIEQIMSIIANIQVNIDYPEYDEEQVTSNNIKKMCIRIIEELEILIKTADTGKIYKEGIRTIILGKPNVGKSSLMNFFLNENRAIVTDIPGTTRDTIEEYVNIEGIPLRIIDTAGIRETSDKIEKIGVDRALDKLKNADLVIMVLDATRKMEIEDLNILEFIKDRKIIYVKNKTDLEDVLHLDLDENIKDEIIDISVKDNIGLDEIINKIKDMFISGKINVENDLIINNVRHKNLLIQSKSNLEEILNGIENKITIDLLEIDLVNCMENLGEIVGKSVSDDLVDKIFSEFCIGK